MPAAGERGSAATEFVLVASVFITILFGILEFGLMMNSKILVTQAAREAARRAAVDGGASSAAISRAIDCLKMGSIDPDTVEVLIRPAEAAYGSTITVRVSCAYKPATAVIAAITRGPVPIQAEVVTRSEKVR
ncbi:MAG: TadE family protein [Ignavibacteriales bacterium]